VPRIYPTPQAPTANPTIFSPPIYVFSGFYAGVNAGGGFGNYRSFGGDNFNSISGFTGGGQIGYNYQLTNNVVVGLETDFQGNAFDEGQKARRPLTAAGFVGVKAHSDYFGTVRARLGYAFNHTGTLLDRTLIYVTAGGAYGQGAITFPGIGTASSTDVGYAVGGGIEYGITQQVTARIEALYVHIHPGRFAFTGLIAPVRNDLEFGVVRAGLNYKF